MLNLHDLLTATQSVPFYSGHTVYIKIIVCFCFHSSSLRAKQSKEYTSLAEKRQALQGKRSLKKTDTDYHKQFPCKKFKRGQCELGDTCKYNHPGVEHKLEADASTVAIAATEKNFINVNKDGVTKTEAAMET